MNFYSEDVIIMRDLFSKGSSTIYFFHEKYLLSPGQLARSLNKLISLNIVRLNDNNIDITEYGVKWIIANRKKIFLTEKEQYWKEIPDFMKRKQISINHLYKPKRKLLDYNYFSKIINMKNGQV